MLFVNNQVYFALEQLDKKLRVYYVERRIKDIYLHRRLYLNYNEYNWQSLRYFFEAAIVKDFSDLFSNDPSISVADLLFREVGLRYNYDNAGFLGDYSSCNATIGDRRLIETIYFDSKFNSKHKVKTQVPIVKLYYDAWIESALNKLYTHCVSKDNLCDYYSELNVYSAFYYDSEGVSSTTYDHNIKVFLDAKYSKELKALVEIIRSAERMFKKSLTEITLDEIVLCSGENLEHFLDTMDHGSLLILAHITHDSRLLDWDFDLPGMWSTPQLKHYGISKKPFSGNCIVCNRQCCTYLEPAVGNTFGEFIHSRKCLCCYKEIGISNFE